ncbi:MAG: hypothetical protein ABH833_02800 [Parcubacteria group bacterium]
MEDPMGKREKKEEEKFDGQFGLFETGLNISKKPPLPVELEMEQIRARVARREEKKEVHA